MLLQSHTGEIHLLPALPSAWSTGRVTGLRARGDVEVDQTWTDGKLTSATLRAHTGGPFKVRYGTKTVTIKLHGGTPALINGDLKITPGR